ncbi:hypothetical protein B0H10DRAFT_1953808 [Mycena sp. CBHHK59/15]|nr:hypothetical protein B0H10DRAFT_1953808 [Mycena sp. CBHHK59/15]
MHCHTGACLTPLPLAISSPGYVCNGEEGKGMYEQPHAPALPQHLQHELKLNAEPPYPLPQVYALQAVVQAACSPQACLLLKILEWHMSFSLTMHCALQQLQTWEMTQHCVYSHNLPTVLPTGYSFKINTSLVPAQQPLTKMEDIQMFKPHADKTATPPPPPEAAHPPAMSVMDLDKLAPSMLHPDARFDVTLPQHIMHTAWPQKAAFYNYHGNVNALPLPMMPEEYCYMVWGLPREGATGVFL